VVPYLFIAFQSNLLLLKMFISFLIRRNHSELFVFVKIMFGLDANFIGFFIRFLQDKLAHLFDLSGTGHWKRGVVGWVCLDRQEIS
jgi:hypothetical protein